MSFLRKIIPKEIRDNPIGQAALGAALGPAGFGVMSAAGAAATVGALSGLATGSLSRGLTAGMAAYGGSTALGMARGVDGGLGGLKGLASKIGFSGLGQPQIPTQQLQANAAQAALQQKALTGQQGIAGLARPTQAARWGGGPGAEVAKTTNALATGASGAAARAAAVPATKAAKQVTTTTQAPNLLGRAWEFAKENPGMTMMGLGLLGSMMDRPQQAQMPQASGVPTTHIDIPRYTFQANPTGARAQGSEEVQHFNPQFVRMAEGGSVDDPLGGLSGQSRQALGYLMGMNGLGGPSAVQPDSATQEESEPSVESELMESPRGLEGLLQAAQVQAQPLTGTADSDSGSGSDAAMPGAPPSGAFDSQRALESAGIGLRTLGDSRLAQAVTPGYALASRLAGNFLMDRAIDNISKQMQALPGSTGVSGSSQVRGVARDSVSPIARAAQMRAAEQRAAEQRAAEQAAQMSSFQSNISDGMSHGDAASAAGMSHADQSAAFGSDGYGGFGSTWRKGGLVRLAQGGSVPTLQEGSFVVPADVVSMIGNGSTDAGLRLLNDKINSHAGGGAIPLRGPGDGQSDDIPTTVEGKVPARVADGEAYISPDTVTRLGGGSLDKGTKRLYAMMDRVRKQAHGRTQQQRPVNIDKVL